MEVVYRVENCGGSLKISVYDFDATNKMLLFHYFEDKKYSDIDAARNHLREFPELTEIEYCVWAMRDCENPDDIAAAAMMMPEKREYERMDTQRCVQHFEENAEYSDTEEI